MRRPGSRGTPLQRVQRPPGGGTDVPQKQPAHHRPDHRDLPGTTDLLPDRTPSPAGHRPADHPRRSLRRTTGQTHWPADLRSTGTAPPDPRRQRPAIKDSTATTTPDPAAGPPRRRLHQTMMIE